MGGWRRNYELDRKAMTMKALLEFLDGRKTYLICLAAIVLLFGSWQKWWVIPPEIYGGLMAAAVAFLRAGVNKIEAGKTEKVNGDDVEVVPTGK